MADVLYIEPAGDDDDYEEEDYTSSSFGDADRRQQQNRFQGGNRKQSTAIGNANETTHQTNPTPNGVESMNQPYIHLNGLLPNMTKNEGELLRLKCNAAGVLPIDFRWYKNDAPLLKEKNRVVVKNRDYWSRLRISRLEPLDQAFYRCEASNKAGIVKTTSLVQVKAGKYRSNINNGVPAAADAGSRGEDRSVDNDDESTFFKPFTCQEYTFEACRDYLVGQRIFIHSKNVEDIRDIDRRLRAAFIVISNSSQVSDECKEYAARAACFHSYQICDSVSSSMINGVYRNGGVGSSANIEPPIRRICRDDCERLEEEICPQEYETARSQNLIGREKDQILPNCRDLPNTNGDKCLRILNDGNTLSSDTSTACYTGNGKTYRGTISTTIGSRRCQSWTDASKKHLLFAPAKYPELKNHNYCRNPGGKKPQPWCFTSEGIEEYCDVPKCISNESGRTNNGGGFDAGIMTIPSEYMQYILLAAGVLGVLLLAVLIGVICYCVRSRRKRNVKGKKTNGGALSSASLGASQALMNGHHNHHHNHNRHHHYGGSGMIANGIRKPIANGQQMELYSLLSPSTAGMSPAPAPMSSIDVPPEIPSTNIRYVEVMGEGQFGKVWLGELVGYTTTATTSSSDDGHHVDGPTTTQIAMKTLRDDSNQRQRQDFEHEVTLKAKLKHPNIVELIGVSCMRTSSSSPSSNTTNLHPTTPCMIFEYMMHGDLNEFLQLRSPYSLTEIVDSQRILLDHNDFLHIAVQIASGMDYLSSQHYIHRDLSTRNCLVADRLTIKISDFGLFRETYAADYYRHQSKNGVNSILPIRWMPPEAIIYGRYSEASDVWSYGITLWEIYSYGKQPFYGYSNAEVMDMIRQRCLPPCPDKCPPRMYSLMMECWHDTPLRRPRFAEILSRLQTWSVVSTPAHSASQSTVTGTFGPSANCYPPPSSIRGGNLTSAHSSSHSSSDGSTTGEAKRIRLGNGIRSFPVASSSSIVRRGDD